MSNTPYITTSSADFKVPAPVDIGAAATDLIGFYGATAIAQPSGAAQAVVAATLVTAVAITYATNVAITAATAIATCTFSAAYTGMWAFASSTVAKTIPARINQLVVDVAAIKAKTDQVKVDLATVKARVDQAKVDGAAIIVLENKLRANLVSLGLIKGSA